MASQYSESSGHAVPSAPYSLLAPSPPMIHIPSFQRERITLVPAPESLDSTLLRDEDIRILTSAGNQVAKDNYIDWAYECRRQAQLILDFLYLGPLSVTRNGAWMRQEGITLVLVARDERFGGGRLMVIDEITRQLGVEVQYLDVSSSPSLVSKFPTMIRQINDHLVSVSRRRTPMTSTPGIPLGQTTEPQAGFPLGKVLVVCETGNNHSACIVAAYIMAVYSQDVISAVQFILLRRFCCGIEEGSRQVLQSWDDILRARRSVSLAHSNVQFHDESRGSKRSFLATFQNDSNVPYNQSEPGSDTDRFCNRTTFVPFLDHSATLAASGLDLDR